MTNKLILRINDYCHALRNKENMLSAIDFDDAIEFGRHCVICGMLIKEGWNTVVIKLNDEYDHVRLDKLSDEVLFKINDRLMKLV